jgi:hypothetical protein
MLLVLFAVSTLTTMQTFFGFNIKSLFFQLILSFFKDGWHKN